MADDPNPDPKVGDDPPADPTKDDPPKGDPTKDDPPAPDPKGTVLTGAEGPQGAPDEYAEFAMPDGMDTNQALLDAAKPIFKKVGLSQIGAQEIVDMFAGQIQTDSTAKAEAYKQQNVDWTKEVKSDPVLGGDKYLQNVGIAKKALDKFGSPGLIQLLDSTGLGNHPEVVRLIYKVGLTLREDDPGGGDPPTGDPKTAAEILYPEQKAAEG